MDIATGLRLARRDLRGSLAGFILFFACTALGVATIAAVGVINAGITTTVERDAAALLGGDLVIEQPNNPIPLEDMPSLLPAGVEPSPVVRTNGMMFNAENRSLAVEIKAVADSYPLYGSIDVVPADPLTALLADNSVVVESSVLVRLDVAVGDSVRIGDAEVRISGIVTREPDQIGGYISLGPRAFMSLETLDNLGILVPGALARYEYRFMLPEPDEAGALEEAIEAANPTENWRVRSKSDVQPRVARFTDRLATYLMMAGLTALVIGGLGIGLSVRAYLQAKTATIATLRCVGAQGRDITVIYGAQIGLLALGGSLLGVILGQLLPFLIAPLVGTMLPVEVELGIEFWPLLYAGMCGLLASTIFALLPLLNAIEVKPAKLFRADLEDANQRTQPSRLLLIAGCALLFAGLVVLGSPRPEIAAFYILAVVVIMGVLAFCARLFMAGTRKARPHVGPRLRMALASLDQPGNGAVSVVVAMGAGLSALVMVGLLQFNLEKELSAQLPDRAPKLVFIDIQPDQVEPLRAAIDAEPGTAILQMAPVLRARITSIKGLPVDQVEIAEDVRWTVRRDRGLTYQGEMQATTELVDGAWWPADYSGPPLVSIEDDVAAGFDVQIGDKLGFNVLGREIEAEIASVRKEIDWSRGQLDFVFIMSPGIIEQAPHTTVAAIDIPKERIDPFIQAVSQDFPNVTPIQIGEAIERVGEIMSKIATAIRIVAVVTLATGVLVLASAVVASRRQHIKRAVLFKVLGSQRKDILRHLLTEHAGLGLVAALIGGTLGAVAAYVLIGPVMGIAWSLSWSVLLGTSLAAIVLAMVVGGVLLGRTLTVPAAMILRRE